MHKVFFYVFIVLLFFDFFAIAQQTETDDPGMLITAADSDVAQFNFDAALQKYYRAIELYKNTSDQKGLADAEYKLGKALFSIGKYSEAEVQLNHSLQLHEKFEDKESIAQDLALIANIHWRQGSYEKSISLSNKSLMIFKEIGNKKGMALAFRNIGIAHDYQGDYEKALDFSRRSIEICEEINDREGLANSLSTRGSTYWKKGDLDLATEEYQKALGIFQELGNIPGQGRVHGNMGLVYWNKGDMDLAIEHTKQSLAFATKVANKASIATNHYNFALMLMEQGDYEKALNSFQESLSQAKEMGDKGLMGVCYEGLGKLAKFSGDWDRALEYFKSSLDIAKEIGEKRAEAYALAAIAHVNDYYGKYQLAIEYYQKAFDLYKEMDDKRGIAKMHESIGYTYSQMNRHEDALKEFYSSLAIIESIKADWNLSENYRMIGMAYNSLNQPDEAEKALSKSIDLAREAGQANTLWQSLYEKGLVYKRAGRSEEALSLLQESTQEIEKVRTTVEDVELRAGYLQDRLHVYEETIPLLVHLNRIPEAFEYVQRSKARSFLDMLAEAQIDSDSGLNPDLKESRKKILAEIMKSQKNLQDEKAKESPEGSKINQIKNKQNQLEKQYADLIQEIRIKNPMYAEVQYPQPLKLAEAQALLDDQTLLFEYSLGTTESLLFVASRENVSAFNLKSEKEIAKLVNELREVMMKPDAVYQASENTYTRYVNLAHALYSEIIKPAESILQKKLRIVIAPDGALSYLPFEALLTQKVKPAGIVFSKLPYMARDYEIDYVPSISVLASIGKNGDNPVPAQKQLLAFADPVLKGARSTLPETKTVRSWAGTLTPLPHAREEVAGIARLYPKEDVTVVMGNEASEANLKKMALQDYRRVHFASHGLIDEEKPQFSALVLTGDNQGEDGFLTMREVFDLKLNADLVVLSACKSGLGKEIRGEGITGISRAFLCAGTPSVIVSLWDVYDRSTADLMTSFYRNLETKNLNKAAALRAARLEMIQSSKYSHPYYWAPFVLIGKR